MGIVTPAPGEKGQPCSRSLRRLFVDWPLVALADARLPAQAPPLPPEEAEQVAAAVPRRQIEFATARLCVRRAATELGVPPFVLRNDANRAPRWPETLVGSLTHTGDVPGGYCAAAVARADDMKAIGLDAENAQALPLHLWRFVLTPDEQVWLSGTDPMGQGPLAKVIFSAKECFYKAQFPLTHQWLGFHGVEIALSPGDCTFQVRLLDRSAPARAALDGLRGRFIRDDTLVKTALALGR